MSPIAAWPRAYRPLHPATLGSQAALVVLAQGALLWAVSDREVWLASLLAALSLQAAWQAAHLLVAARPARGQVASLLPFQVAALGPALFPGGAGREQGPLLVLWPAGSAAWPVLGLALTGAYAALLSLWLRARDAEAAGGLAPALGMGGAAVIRVQGDPRRRDLFHVHAGPGTDAAPAGTPAKQTQHAPIVLLHGLGATSASWSLIAQGLAAAGRRVLAPDLLGFGSSMRLGTRFRLEDQARAVERLLDRHAWESVHVVGHSWGCAVAAAVASRSPERVSRLTLIAPAVFADAARARDRIGSRSLLARAAIDGPEVGGLICGVMCLLRPVLATIAPRAEPDVPPEVARGGVQHTYPAYHDALNSLWQDNPLPALLAAPSAPVTVVLARDDRTVLPEDVTSLPRDGSVSVVDVPGSHGVIFEHPVVLVRVILAAHADPSR